LGKRRRVTTPPFDRALKAAEEPYSREVGRGARGTDRRVLMEAAERI
jgi:hypothetical protein